MQFDKVALIGRYQDTGLDAPLIGLAEKLIKTGRKVIIEAETAKNTNLNNYEIASLKEIGENVSLAIVMGGDGTVLGTARSLAPYNVPLLGINHGKLGFITDIPIEDAYIAIMNIINGNFFIEERKLLQGSVLRTGKKLFSSTALNDIVINRSNNGGMIEIKIDLNGEFMHIQRADGLIISTPTGSTAYSLAVNGPILHPSLEAMLIVPIAPQTLSNRPIVIPSYKTLELTLISSGRINKKASVHFDMQPWSELKSGDKIKIQSAKHSIKLIHPSGYSFFSTLRRKLHWNLMPQFSEYFEK
ncbi:NAD kinase [Candidatus Kinetoplastibacterium sorsogonicusi]|uniref:NAD kinase n=1 Tax=Candidatus Kinetoplastidibacterium kentomonadis TaxID=1576550 RepID=A0A3S7JAB0_9PROT|nr:NAD kinase [Candidatus Kinetoplastibacterium sorsogonicusi]AWD32617.1 NAD kinase [Candidatus Kinetoplastibacterium sorsogonicusi]